MAATEDRIDVFYNELDRRVLHQLTLKSSEILYANTIAELDAGEIAEYTHTSGNDESSKNLLAVRKHMEEDEESISNLKATYPNSSLTDAIAFSGVLMEFNVDETDTSGYSLFADAYAVDNDTVANASGDGSGGTYPTLGPVYSINSNRNTVTVLVEGIDA